MPKDLIIDGKALYESDDIIDYLRTRVEGEAQEADFSDLKDACPVPWLQ